MRLRDTTPAESENGEKSFDTAIHYNEIRENNAGDVSQRKREEEEAAFKLATGWRL